MNDKALFEPLTPEERKTLAAFLESEQVHPEAFDFVQLHGFLTALAIMPETISEAEWLESVFVEAPRYADDAERAQLTELITRLGNSISRDLYSGEPLKLPCSLTLGKRPDEAPLRGWAIGFMEAVHFHEERWFGNDDEELGELILPVALASGLFEDESFDRIYGDPDLVKELCLRIPETLSDLYLCFRGQDAEE